MKAARWHEIKSVLATVLDTEPDQRPATLDRLCDGDADLRREVESLLALEKRAGDDLNTALVPGALLRADPETPPERIGPYRILREIGRGGMGVVYLGERDDGEYKKQVAIKLITAGRRTATADPLGLERRFRRERQILSQFEHPGIARMIDGGATQEGQPYFVMEYVQGLPLLDYCDAHRLAISTRLTLFLSICDAVAHAHRRLIVHRDLKPGNILVTPDGSPKLLDFGLARVLDSTDAADEITQAILPMLTPAYASPEQIRGEPFSVSSDVYSLGVILFELLAAQRPYQLPSGSLAEMVRIVCQQVPARLSQIAITEDAATTRSSNPERLRRQLAGDLENIAAKALEKDPSRRYATVDDFAADIRRHLTGLPVRARPATFAYRAAKFIQRHRVAVPVTSLAAILILTSAGVAWFEAIRAQRRFDQVRSLAHTVMFDLHDSIANLPGSTKPRQLLVASALQYLEQLSSESAGNSKLAWEIALGYERVGVVQGYGAEENLGQPIEATKNLEKALSILDRYSAASSGNREMRHDYLRIRSELAHVLDESGNGARASDLIRRNSEIADTALRAHPADFGAIDDAARAAFDFADLMTREQKYDDAIPIREHTLALYEQLAAKNPSSLETQRSIALCHKKLAALYGVTKRYQESRTHYNAARVIDEKRLGLNPSMPRSKLDLSYDYSDLGWVSSRLEDDNQALEWHRKAQALRADAVKSDPNDVRAAYALSSTDARMAAVLRRLGHYDEALALARTNVDECQRLLEKSPASIESVTNLADAHAEIGHIETALAAQQFPSGSAKRRELLQSALQEINNGLSAYLALRDKGKLPKSDSIEIENMTADLAKLRDQLKIR